MRTQSCAHCRHTRRFRSRFRLHPPVSLAAAAAVAAAAAAAADEGAAAAAVAAAAVAAGRAGLPTAVQAKKISTKKCHGRTDVRAEGGRNA